MIEIGKFYKAKPMFTILAEQIGGVPHNGNGAIQPKIATGKCVFSHPKGRFVTLEFPFRGGRYPGMLPTG